MRIFRHAAIALAAAVLAGCAAPKPDSPEACRLEPRGKFRLAFDHRVPTVPVALDGRIATMLFDTGATGTTVTGPGAERLNLLGNGNVRITTTGLGGESKSFAAGIGRIGVGGAVMVNQRVTVLTFDLRGFGDHPPDGLLGMDFLSNFDVEADLQTGDGTLYSPRNCPSARPDWNVRSSTLEFAPSAGSGRLLLELELDGRKVIATLDTGSSGSIVNTAVAHALGLTDEILAKDPAVKGFGIAEKDAEMHAHRFARLRIGMESVTNPFLLVADLPSAADDMLLGMNYLRNRKIWISASSRRVHISAPLPAAAKPPS